MKRTKKAIFMICIMLVTIAGTCFTASADGDANIYIAVKNKRDYGCQYVKADKVWAEREGYDDYIGEPYWNPEEECNYGISILSVDERKTFNLTIKAKYKGETKTETIEQMGAGEFHVSFIFEYDSLISRDAVKTPQVSLFKNYRQFPLLLRLLSLPIFSNLLRI